MTRRKAFWMEFAEVGEAYAYAKENGFKVIELRYFDYGPVSARLL